MTKKQILFPLLVICLFIKASASTPCPDWAKNAVFYQIYPQTFRDSNGDGVGDLPGITQKLDYVKSLGVDAIWINPFYKSPFRDAGYDVSDYYSVAPRYGTNEDAKRLFDKAHELGLKVIIDFVPGHTSIDHPWFKDSCKPTPNKHSNWYIWTDGTWFNGMDKYSSGFIQGYCERNGNYMTNFFWHQPALNYGWGDPDPEQPWQLTVDNPDVLALRAEMVNVLRFWLNMGCDGFRIDMAGSLVKNDPNHRILDFWHQVRTMLDVDYPEAFIVSEWSDPKVALQDAFHADFLHWFPGYESLWTCEDAFFRSEGNGSITDFLKAWLPQYKATLGKGYISLPVGNHDLARIRRENRDQRDVEQIFVFQFTMPNVPFIYYGDEIGMRQLDIVRNKEGCYGGRAGARTPMQWQSKKPNLGFSSSNSDKLWMPMDDSEDAPTVSEEEHDDKSMLSFTRKLIALKKNCSALKPDAEFQIVYAKANSYPFAFERNGDGQRLLVVLNPSERGQSFETDLQGINGTVNLLFGSMPQFESTSDSKTKISIEAKAYAVLELLPNKAHK
jgi:maltose alpha-D-glucosyltransferase/alpha-amylase